MAFTEQEPGTELIDMEVIDGALNYIVRNQGRDGQLPITGRVHNFGLVVHAHVHTHTHTHTHTHNIHTYTLCIDACFPYSTS